MLGARRTPAGPAPSGASCATPRCDVPPDPGQRWTWRWAGARQARSGSKWIGVMPAARAPATSAASVSPTWTTSVARMPAPARARAASKIRTSGLPVADDRGVDHGHTDEPAVAQILLGVSVGVRDDHDREPAPTERGDRLECARSRLAPQDLAGAAAVFQPSPTAFERSAVRAGAIPSSAQSARR